MSDRTSFYPELAETFAPADGQLAVLLQGLGAVAPTLVAGVRMLGQCLASATGRSGCHRCCQTLVSMACRFVFRMPGTKRATTSGG